MLRPDDSGNTALIGLLVGGLVFVASFVAVVQVSVDPEQDLPQGEQATAAGSAAALVDLLINSPGTGWYNGDACLTGTTDLDDTRFQPESVTRMGLAEEHCAIGGDVRAGTANLSYEKMLNLYQAKLTADADNDILDYAEALESLGLDDTLQSFHIRTWPVLPSIQRILQGGDKDPNLRPLYIGDYTKSGGEAGSRAVQHVKGVVDGSESVTVYVNITNNGTASTILGVFFSIPLSQGNIEFTLHTDEMAVSDYYNVTFQIRKTSDWVWADAADPTIDYTIEDKAGDFQSGTISLSGVTMTYASQRELIFAEADKLYFELTAADVRVKYHYASYDGHGQGDNFGDWTYVLKNPSGTTIQTDVLASNRDSGFEQEDVSALGAWTARIENDALTSVWNSDLINIVAAEPNGFTVGATPTSYTAGDSVEAEMGYIHFLIENFEANVFDVEYDTATVSYAAGGDVYPDLKDVLNNDVAGALTDADGNATLDNYNILFVGTSTDHTAMTSQAAKGTIRDWVLAGGTLVVFGSADQQVTWLQPLFHVALTPTSTGIGVPDETHPILRTPNTLDADAYDPHGTAWDFNQEDDRNLFTHVVTSGTEDVLAVSNPGAFGDGRVLLTSWQPYDLTYGDPGDECAPATLTANCVGLQLIDNFVTISYRGLYLDYGPTIPESEAQGVQSRVATIWHPELRRHVELYVLVFVF